MTIEQITTYMSEPEKLVDPRLINTISGYISGYITDLEEQNWEERLTASNKRMQLVETAGAVNKAEAMWELTPEYAQWKKTERLIKRLKRFRADLKDRFQVLTNTKRF